MQYKVFCDDYILYDSQLNKFQLSNPVLKQELNSVQELSFTIHPSFHNEKKIICEGVLAFLLDTVIRPFDFPNDEEFQDLDYDNDNVIEYFLNWILTCHNSQAKDFQKIKLGNVTVTDSNNYLARSSIEFLSAWEVITSRLLKTHGDRKSVV